MNVANDHLRVSPVILAVMPLACDNKMNTIID